MTSSLAHLNKLRKIHKKESVTCEEINSKRIRLDQLEKSVKCRYSIQVAKQKERRLFAQVFF